MSYLNIDYCRQTKEATKKPSESNDVTIDEHSEHMGISSFLYKYSLYFIKIWKIVQRAVSAPRCRNENWELFLRRDTLQEHIDEKNQRNVTMTSPWISIRLGKCGTLKKLEYWWKDLVEEKKFLSDLQRFLDCLFGLRHGNFDNFLYRNTRFFEIFLTS